MDNINRMEKTKYINQKNNNQNNTIHKYYSYNPSLRKNTNISNITTNKYQINKNNVSSKENNLLKRQFNQKELKENIKTDYNYNKTNIDNNNMINGNKRINHKIFVRIATKNKEDINNNLNNNKRLSSMTYTSNYNQKTNILKSNTPSINYKSYQDSKTKIIPLKRPESNISSIKRDSNNKSTNNYTQNISYRTYNKYNSTEKTIENLMNIINKQVGINNLGNSCFINSSLQIFIHCPLFINKLISKEKTINENTPITFSFYSICDTILKTKSKYISIYSFKNILGLKHKSFSGFIQQDSQEFIRLFLEDLSKELNEIKYNTNIYRLLSNTGSKTKKVRDEDFHLNFSRREKSIITDILLIYIHANVNVKFILFRKYWIFLCYFRIK